eukprot:COSAG02_NODE_17417_length_1005_cov_1.919426_2_plen_26_part_01
MMSHVSKPNDRQKAREVAKYEAGEAG